MKLRVTLALMMAATFLSPAEVAAEDSARASIMMDRLNRMTPERRARILGRLSEERRARIEERLRQYNSASPERKRRLEAALERFRHMPESRQGDVRRTYSQLNRTPYPRQRELRAEVQRLRRLNDEDRQARMRSFEFQEQYQPEERQLIENLVAIASTLGTDSRPTPRRHDH
jgi:flagellar motor switch protein FliG